MELTERASQVLGQARYEARRLAEHGTGADDVLLAMLRDTHGAAAYVLTDFGIDYNGIFERMAGSAAHA